MPVAVLLLILSAFVLISVLIIGSPPTRKFVKPRSPAKRPGYEWICSGRGGYSKKWTFEEKLVEDIWQKEKWARQLKKALTDQKQPTKIRPDKQAALLSGQRKEHELHR